MLRGHPSYKATVSLQKGRHFKWVSAWLLFNACWAIFQLYHGKNKLIFHEMMMWSYANMLSCIFIVIAHWNSSPRKDMSPHSDTFFWFRANFSLMLLAYRRSNKYQFYSLWSDMIRLEPTICRTRDEHANHYTTDAVCPYKRGDYCAIIYTHFFVPVSLYHSFKLYIYLSSAFLCSMHYLVSFPSMWILCTSLGQMLSVIVCFP